MVRRRFALLYAVVVLFGMAAVAAVVVARPTVDEATAKIPRDPPTTTTTTASTTTTALPVVKRAARLATLDVSVEAVDLVRVGALPAELPRDVRDRVVGVVTSYVQRATVDTMTTGRRAVGVRDLFTGGAERRLLSGDRASLVDEGLPAARPVGRPVAELRLTALAGASGAVELVTVGLLVDVQGVTADGRAVKINRLGELTLAPVEGRWRVESYSVFVERQVEEAA